MIVLGSKFKVHNKNLNAYISRDINLNFSHRDNYSSLKNSFKVVTRLVGMCMWF